MCKLEHTKIRDVQRSHTWVYQRLSHFNLYLQFLSVKLINEVVICEFKF